MKAKLIFCILIFNVVFSFSLKNMVFANSYGEEINFSFFDNKENALASFNNSVWVESVKGGYDIKYDAYTNIAGFQFEIDKLDNIDHYEFINGQVKDNKFTLQVKNNVVIGFSFEGATLPTGLHTLFEIRYSSSNEDKQLNETTYIDNKYNKIACSIPENHIYLKDSFVLYNSNEDIGGFQFSIDNGEIINLEGGEAILSDFTVTNSQTIVLGFSFSGSYIPKGCGVLTGINYKGNNVTLGNVVVSDKEGTNLNITIFEEYTLSKKPSTYLENYSSKDIDITQIVISGSGGASVETNFICHKKNCKDFRYDVPMNNPTGLTTLSINSNGNNKWIMSYDSNVDIAGYQFNVEGGSIKSASGGDSAKNGFTISKGDKTILAFSFQGDVISAGKGVLLEFVIE